MGQDEICCPFCGFDTNSEYQIMLHMETKHAEGDESPFVVKDDDASIAAILAMDEERSTEPQYSNCPVEGCGEALLWSEFDSHLEMHSAELETGDDESGPASKKLKLNPAAEASFSTKLSHALRNIDDVDDRSSSSRSPESDRQEKAKDIWKKMLKMPDTPSKSSSSTTTSKNARRRLGKSELGPHANEKQMPSWLVKLLESDGEMTTVNRLDGDGKLKKVKFCPNRTSGILPVLEQLLRQDRSTEYAYLCDPAVKHVSKLKREGGFCGYRNIQMLSSYIIGARSQGHQYFNGKIPTIFDIQEYIENAWDIGINTQGRVETGGIRGTRKYIGTPDAQAMFCSLGIACDAQGLKPKKDKKDAPSAYHLLFQAVEAYFANGCVDFNSKVRCTTLPPIYFQHPGHSMTIVGFERRSDGTKDILVFDPMFHDAPNITKLIGQRFTHKAPADALKAYRRGVPYLRKYNEFELLKFVPSICSRLILLTINED
ncbi:hypothetical protein G7Y89_g3448 [Cudoniella acicularis]|uniref:C2H2-type domain-containing protein n=1 Tax=Cudoniella acicularis TaxID=354080 RepID=A0A8H4RRD1_9HELO|nr:hypothetical protein G7Y89_g3448 [Cudoniella acicularis]